MHLCTERRLQLLTEGKFDGNSFCVDDYPWLDIWTYSAYPQRSVRSDEIMEFHKEQEEKK